MSTHNLYVLMALLTKASTAQQVIRLPQAPLAPQLGSSNPLENNKITIEGRAGSTEAVLVNVLLITGNGLLAYCRLAAMHIVVRLSSTNLCKLKFITVLCVGMNMLARTRV